MPSILCTHSLTFQPRDMINMFSLPFQYRDHIYKALVAIRKHPDHKEYRITVMNGELEKLLFGHHIIVEQSGRFITDPNFQNDDVRALQDAILQALNEHYEKLTIYSPEKMCHN